MPGLTRRRALLAVASGVAMLTGCAGNDDRATTDPTDRRRHLDDYDVRNVRNEDGDVLFAQGDELPTVTDDERDRYARSSRVILVDEEGLEELTFGDSPEANELSEFVTATDFDSSSVYLIAMPVEACYEIRLQSVTLDWDEWTSEDLHPHADFCRAFRPANVHCAADEVHTTGFAIRLPVTAERSSGSGRGMARNCRSPRREEYFEANVTPETGGESE